MEIFHAASLTELQLEATKKREGIAVPVGKSCTREALPFENTIVMRPPVLLFPGCVRRLEIAIKDTSITELDRKGDLLKYYTNFS